MRKRIFLFSISMCFITNIFADTSIPSDDFDGYIRIHNNSDQDVYFTSNYNERTLVAAHTSMPTFVQIDSGAGHATLDNWVHIWDSSGSNKICDINYKFEDIALIGGDQTIWTDNDFHPTSVDSKGILEETANGYNADQFSVTQDLPGQYCRIYRVELGGFTDGPDSTNKHAVAKPSITITN